MQIPIKIPATIENPNSGVGDDLMVKPPDKLAVLKETYEKLAEDVNNLLNSQDNLLQPDHQKDVENITISVDSSMGNMKERLLAKDVEISKLKVDVEQLKFIHVAQGNCIRNMKHNHLKEKEKMGTVNRTLKFCWANLKKEKENLNGCIVELMKDKEKWSIEKTPMECCIADLKKAGEAQAVVGRRLSFLPQEAAQGEEL
ncbi:hypothetical protein ZWY2020_005862 [Hordeum vulgare]|nr:hypothetical protein ZWY2020_005862 [Hordeum vulgare]